MKILVTAILCLMLTVTAFADQRTTVLSVPESGSYPYIDGSNDAALEKSANDTLRRYAKDLLKEVGNGGTLSYEVTLNRPSLVSILLKADNGGSAAYRGVNIDLTSGREFSVHDFFIDDADVQAALGSYSDVLFTEDGIATRTSKTGAYSTLVPYSKLLPSMRIGEAGRLLQVVKLTQNAAGKVLTMEKGSLMAIKLDSNPSTGYGWTMQLDKAHEGKLVKVGSSFMMPRAGDQRVGTPGSEITFYAAREAGTYNVTMAYGRPWEKRPVNSFAFTVIVK